MATRRTMPIFAASDVWLAAVTSRRTSLPANGLAMTPTTGTPPQPASSGRSTAARMPATIADASGT